MHRCELFLDWDLGREIDGNRVDFSCFFFFFLCIRVIRVTINYVFFDTRGLTNGGLINNSWVTFLKSRKV